MSRASPPPVRAVHSPYEQFLATVGRQPTAAQYEQWADEHLGDPDQGRALVHAGWLTARGKQHQGDDAKALELFTRAKLSGAAGRQAQVGAVETLYAQDRERDAEQAEQALREELTEQPDEAVADLQVFDDMVDMLGEIGRSERALDWCLAALAHPAARENEGTVGGETARLRRGLRISRALLRRDLGLEPTDDDLAAEAETDAELREFGEELDRALSGLPSGRPVEVPEDTAAFDGIVLRWVREDFAAVRTRWPESTDSYGDNYTAYIQRLQTDARTFAEAGAARVHIVSATLAACEEFAVREGRDADNPDTRRAFSRHVVRAHPDESPAWPAPRNGPCWCDSGRKYKKCCGAPARN
ncbi:SEC-C metal-binding domain-containing protein [Streptomyces sp. NPDC020794]|uniref:SEC-C domain-containing protein n=1 Tax=unclassified Streptomyces TaxID=2593676 RepID=UPI0036F13144